MIIKVLCPYKNFQNIFPKSLLKKYEYLIQQLKQIKFTSTKIKNLDFNNLI